MSTTSNKILPKKVLNSMLNNRIQKCKACKVILTDKNWWVCSQKTHKYICCRCDLSHQKEYREKNKIRVKKVRNKYYKQHKDKICLDLRNKRKEIKIKIEEILGKKCILCYCGKKLLFHEIHGKPHPSRITYILNHPKDFVCLCYRCHIYLHRILKFIKNKGVFINMVKKFVNK